MRLSRVRPTAKSSAVSQKVITMFSQPKMPPVKLTDAQNMFVHTAATAM